MNRYEFRVVWKRRGMPQKSKRYATLRGAEKRMLFMGPEPWKALEVEPDELRCCPGTAEHECACGGLTWRESLLGDRLSSGPDPDSSGMPPIEYMHIERRPCSPWEPT